MRLPGRFRAWTVLRLGLGLGLCAGLLLPGSGVLPSASADAADWDVPGGHFFTQTGGGTGKGYLVADDGAAAFWSAFQSLGGVAVVGYPVSRRFMHGGFVTQAMQKAVFQWRPESKSVAFVNVFDDLSAAGKDDFLLEVRSTPKPAPFPDEAGRPFGDVIKIRQSALDVRPAMKAIYFAAGDPVLQYGLPTSQVADMGSHFAIRLQRAVIQEWKQDVPWARAGQATVANGGDIGKEAGLWPAAAVVPGDPTDAGPVVAQPTSPPPPAATATSTPLPKPPNDLAPTPTPKPSPTLPKFDCKNLNPELLLAVGTPTTTPTTVRPPTPTRTPTPDPCSGGSAGR